MTTINDPRHHHPLLSHQLELNTELSYESSGAMATTKGFACTSSLGECPSAMTFDSKIKKQRKTGSTKVEQAKHKKKKRSLIEEIVKNTPSATTATCHSPHLSSTSCSPLIHSPTRRRSPTNSSLVSYPQQQVSSSTMFIDCSNSISHQQQKNLWTSSMHASSEQALLCSGNAPLALSEHTRDPHDEGGDMCQVILTNWKSRSETRQWIKKCINETTTTTSDSSSPLLMKKKHQKKIQQRSDLSRATMDPSERIFPNGHPIRIITHSPPMTATTCTGTTTTTSNSSNSSKSNSSSNQKHGVLPTYVYTTCPLPFQKQKVHSSLHESGSTNNQTQMLALPSKDYISNEPSSSWNHRIESFDCFGDKTTLSEIVFSKQNSVSLDLRMTRMEDQMLPQVAVLSTPPPLPQHLDALDGSFPLMLQHFPRKESLEDQHRPMMLPSFREFVSTLGLQ
ncbi:hypothetical protein FDP41_006894 [Naegleria fowleri]|uniref:Uncharacterized protein n=1 Tax=Naegleria fowleri TaxID=5763 RepID=A0A6A5BJT1_NAEFO|nr:uncharacterized protein FDP41_006894 [Naegleria fowleri]KAF0974284.1 hypothetical protein FDP41_006894 [Naegleria fowleri]